MGILLEVTLYSCTRVLLTSSGLETCYAVTTLDLKLV